MTDTITLQALATVAGASIVAIALTRFVGVFWHTVSAQANRMLSATFGLAFVVGATILSGPVTPEIIVLAVIVGVQAGLAASKAYEIGVGGLDHATTPR